MFVDCGTGDKHASTSNEQPSPMTVMLQVYVPVGLMLEAAGGWKSVSTPVDDGRFVVWRAIKKDVEHPIWSKKRKHHVEDTKDADEERKKKKKEKKKEKKSR